MTRISPSPVSRAARKIDLAVHMHCEALLKDPPAYLSALRWWVLRKRVRARGQFAALLGRTSAAYGWWMLKEAARQCASTPATPPIVALVDGGAGDEEITQTLASLAREGITAYIAGSDVAADLARAGQEIDWSADPWLLPLKAGDCIAPGAARTYRAAIGSGDGVLVYADEDRLDSRGQRDCPHFKPDWNPELFRHYDYLTGACVVRADRTDLARAARAGDWARALVADALSSGDRPVHVPQVLHHRRTLHLPAVPVASLAPAESLPGISVIVPTRNRVDLLATCIAGLEAADYPDVEVIVVDNDSDDAATLAFLDDLPSRDRSGFRIWSLRHPGAFNYSRINNRAVAAARGELLCLLNNDIEMLSTDWLSIMATQALRDEVGAVGAQLLYPDGRIQHAGVVIGMGNAAGHAHRCLRPEEQGYFRRHALPQFVTAVTGACLVVRRDRFLAVGGLDENAFPVAFNDVDLCLKLNGEGWQSFYEPRAVLVHHESLSRGFDRDPEGAARFAKELAALKNRWRTMEVYDPYHHPQLSRASEQFVLAL